MAMALFVKCKQSKYYNIMSQLIYKNGCWGCLQAREDPSEKYVCPKIKQHLTEYEKQQKKEL